MDLILFLGNMRADVKKSRKGKDAFGGGLGLRLLVF